MRAEPGSASKERAVIRKLVLGKGKQPTYKAADIWTGTYDQDKKLLATSLLDYLVFGPNAAQFGKLLSQFRPSDEVQNPDMGTALKAMEITPEALDKAWKKWVASGK